MSLKELLKELLSLPVKGFARAKAAVAAGAAKVKDAFTHKEGKMLLRMGTSVQNSGSGNPLELVKLRSNRWTRLKKIIAFPFMYVWHGKAEL